MRTSEKSYFVVCTTTRPDLLPTQYYDSHGNLDRDREAAARFFELDEVLKFVEKHKINLGESCHIGLLVDDH